MSGPLRRLGGAVQATSGAWQRCFGGPEGVRAMSAPEEEHGAHCPHDREHGKHRDGDQDVVDLGCGAGFHVVSVGVLRERIAGGGLPAADRMLAVWHVTLHIGEVG